MSNENQISAAIEPVVNPAEPTQQNVEVTPEPTQEKSAEELAAEKAEAERKAEKRRERRERREYYKEYYELKAKTEFLERQLRRQEEQQNPKQDDDDDSDPEEKIVERVRREFEVKEIEKRKDDVFSKAGVTREEFSENVEVVTPVMAEAILDSDVAPKLVKYLNENPEEADRIASLKTSRQVAEIVKLELKLSEQQPAKKSSAPSPIKPISGKSPSASGYRADMSDDDFRKLRKQGKVF